jgi:hypothetical protein
MFVSRGENGVSYMEVTVFKWKVGITSAEIDNLVRKVQTEGIPLLRQQPGFLLWRAMPVDEEQGVHVNEWESKEQCEAGMQAYGEWFRSRDLPALFQFPTQRLRGKVSTSS